MSKRITIPVTGMHCAACQSRVQSALAGTPGVAEASVNLMLNNASVTYDEDAVAPQTLVETIKSTGYDAKLPAPDDSAFEEQREQERAHEHEVRELTRKTVTSLLVAAITMALPMVLMDAAWMPWASLALTTLVVLWPGRQFYTRAWRAFRHHTADMNTLIAVGTGAAYLYSVWATVAPQFFASRGM